MGERKKGKIITTVRKNPETIRAILALDDETLYSAPDVARLYAGEDRKLFSLMKRRMQMFRRNHSLESLAEAVEVAVGPGDKAWKLPGHVWKAQLNPEEKAFIQRLDRDEEHTGEEIGSTATMIDSNKSDRDVAEDQTHHTATTHTATRRSTRSRFGWMIAVFLLVPFLVAYTLINWVQTPAVTTTRSLYRIGFLANHESFQDGMFPTLFYEQLSKLEFQAIPQHQLSDVQTKDFSDASAELDADILITGGFIEDSQSGFHWRGRLWIMGRDEKLALSGKSIKEIARQLREQLLAGLAAPKSLPEVDFPLSDKPTANFLFSEGRFHFGQGNFRTAYDLFKRAASFDKQFELAVYMEAVCLDYQGDVKEAETIIQGLIQSKHLDIVLRAYQFLVEKSAYANMAHEKGAALAETAIDLAADTRPLESYRFSLYRHQLTAALDCPEPISEPPDDNPILWFEYYFTLGMAQYLNNRPQNAVPYFEDAFDVGMANYLHRESFHVLEYLCRAQWQMGAGASLNQLSALLVSLKPMAEDNGDLFALLQIDFWRAMLQSTAIPPESAEQVLSAIVDRSRDLGSRNHEVWAAVQWFDIAYANKSISLDCERTLLNLVSESSDLRPYLQLAVLFRANRLYRYKNQEEMAIAPLERALAVSHEGRLSERTLGSISNELGWVYYLNHQYDKAKTAFLEARGHLREGDQLRETVEKNLALVESTSKSPQ